MVTVRVAVPQSDAAMFRDHHVHRPIGPFGALTGDHYTHDFYCRNGLSCFSRPTVVGGPCPENTAVSSGSTRTFWKIEAMSVAMLPPGRSVPAYRLTKQDIAYHYGVAVCVVEAYGARGVPGGFHH